MDGNTKLHSILSEGNIDQFNDLFANITIEDLKIQNDNLDTPFHTGIRNSCHYANLKLYAMALKEDPSVLIIKNANRQTVLELSLVVNNYGMVKKFLKVPELVNHIDSQGLNVLMRLISNREDELAIKIIRTPNMINYQTIGKFGTILHTAVLFCAYEVVEALLEDPRINEIINVENGPQGTALNLAVMDESGTIALKIFSKGGTIIFNMQTINQIVNSHEPKIREILWPLLYLSIAYRTSTDLLVRILRFL